MSDKTEEDSVLGSLPATRPTRFGAEKRKTANGKTASAKPRKTASVKPKKAAAAKPKAAPKAAARKPRPVRAGAPSLAESTKRARAAEPPPRSTTTPPSGTELVTTAIKAAGELAQIGLAVGGQALRRAVDRLPKP
jgi:hypothetical protein